jgi:hypothetical protein
MASAMDDDLEKLLEAGWVVRDGNDLKMTDKGRAALRRGIPGFSIPGENASVDSVRARTKLPVKKFKKRKNR